jgi:hypothetical protein
MPFEVWKKAFWDRLKRLVAKTRELMPAQIMDVLQLHGPLTPENNMQDAYTL